MHKLSSLAIAAFGVAAHHGSEKTMKGAGLLAIGINTALAYDYYKGWTDPGRTTMLDSGVVEVPGLYDARVALSQLSKPMLPQLEAGGPIVELKEYTGNSGLPEGTYKEIPLSE